VKKDINKEIEKLLMIKAEVDEIEVLKNTSELKVEVVSQLMYDYMSSNNLLQPDTFYCVTSLEVGKYIEGFRG
jgi:hypothetical protein